MNESKEMSKTEEIQRLGQMLTATTEIDDMRLASIVETLSDFVQDNERVKLGDRVKDIVTGLTGIATGKCFYLTGCTQVLIKPEALKDGAILDGHWIDIQRVTVLVPGAIQLNNDETPGGPQEVPSRV